MSQKMQLERSGDLGNQNSQQSNFSPKNTQQGMSWTLKLYMQ